MLGECALVVEADGIGHIGNRLGMPQMSAIHVEADLRWLDHIEARLATLAEEVRDGSSSGRA